MNHILLSVLEAFPSRRVLVVGEAMLDSYLHGETHRLCREAPVPVVDTRSVDDVPGGAANAAVNAAALGADVTFLSVVGDDPEADRLAAALDGLGVSGARLVRDPARRTLVKQRVLAGPQILLRLDSGSTAPVAGEAEAALIRALGAAWKAADTVVLSDYGYGVLSEAVIDAVADLQARDPRVLVADAKDLRRLARTAPTAVKPNHGEAVFLLSLPAAPDDAARVDQVMAREADLLRLTNARVAAVTLDVAGGVVFERGKPAYRTYTRPAPNSNATGAGDTFVAALALALASGAETPACADLASAAATVVVGRGGTTACTRSDLRLFLASQDKVVEDGDVAALVASLRAAGRRVVFTNGCFDLLHRGHVTYLNRAKALGDVLIVGLNADASVRRLKGPTRPVNRAADRAQVLAALSCVDHIVEFAEDTPARLIEQVRPDVYAKGGDYTLETLPEAAQIARLGGRVELLPYLEDFSTTGMLARAGRQAGD